MKSFTIFFSLLLLGIVDAFAQDNCIEGRIVVKFTEGSPVYSEWKAGGRDNALGELAPIVGKHRCYAYVSDNLLQAMYKKHSVQGNAFIELSRTKIFPMLKSIERIAVIEYSADISPALLASKVSTLPFVEYAEPVYKREFIETTNDSLLAEQYSLPMIQAMDAWPLVPAGSSVTVGIVDSGVDYTHVDLKDNIWSNPGETGKDANNQDKSTNGIDDDENGFVDDWRGWDLVSSDSLGYDNDPMPGNRHGTHVAGIVAAVQNNRAGIAGVACNVKLIPAKVGSDNTYSSSIYNGYQGILYATAAGADVINCSWGGSGYSLAEQEIITTAVTSGSVIVAAAGNSYSDAQFYPSAYDGIMSVVSTDINDRKSGFSNYHLTNDVSAPGSSILSTIPGDEYEVLSGTSMASPCATGVAALVRLKHPELNPVQVIEWVKASSDNIDTLNPNYARKMGRGRVNAYKALTMANAYSVVLTKYGISDSNKDSVFDAGDVATITPVFRNILSPIGNARIVVSALGTNAVTFDKPEIAVGPMATDDETDPSLSVSFTVPDNIPVDFTMPIEFKIYDGDKYINSLYIEMVLRPSYRTMDGNNISVTFNSRGNLAFNDYPSNRQGIGFRYKNSSSFLFEGALMVGVDRSRVSNVARASSQGGQDISFNSFDVFSIGRLNDELLVGKAFFEDDNNGFSDAGVKVKQTAVQSSAPGLENVIFINNYIYNNTSEDFDSLFAGLFFDWDIGPSGRPNVTYFDYADSIGYDINTADSSYPKAAAILLTSQPLNFFAIDNDGSTEDNPGIYDGYDVSEKWYMLSNGIKRPASDTTDASMVISAGPVRLNSGDSVLVCFALISGYNTEDIALSAKNARAVSSTLGVHDRPVEAADDGITLVWPNPASDGAEIEFYITSDRQVEISLHDITGRKVSDICKGSFQAGLHRTKASTADIAPGIYFLHFNNGDISTVKTLTVVR